MRQFFILCSLFITFFLSADAREEAVLSLPKSGTHYLKKIIENITGNRVIQPSVPYWYKKAYMECAHVENIIVMGHCEPLIQELLPDNEELLLLIRDPRDVALSAIDFIDNSGLAVWPGLLSIINAEEWSKLSKLEKISLILENSYDYRKVSIVSLFETAINLCSQKKCFIVKYEQLSPEYNDFEELSQTIQNIAHFFGMAIDETKARDVINKSFKNHDSATLNKGNAFRYLEEDPEIVSFLNSKLKKYIYFFDFVE